MRNKSWIFPAFVIVAIIQLFVPAKMIWQKEAVLREGEAFKFKTAPIDPYDPFRGKYVALSFEDQEFDVPKGKNWQYGQDLYLTITKDNKDFAEVLSISETEPRSETSYVRVEVANFYSDPEQGYVIIRYPFDRFYMDEFKAYEAELGYREVQRDTSQLAYALVKIKDGQAVLENVFIDDVPLAEVARRRLAAPRENGQ